MLYLIRLSVARQLIFNLLLLITKYLVLQLHYLVLQLMLVAS